MRVKVLGSGREVGRAAIAVEDSGGALLMDYGVNFDENDNPIFPEHIRPRDLAGVVLTHSHLDHVGAAPLLYVSHAPPLFATPVTLDVTRVLLYDMIKLNGQLLPFDEGVVNEMLGRATSLPYREEVELGNFTFKLLPSGHIPGSAGVLVETRRRALLYTSDVNVIETKLTKPADMSGVRADAVIVESTYGSTNHPPREVTEQRFISSLKEVVESGGIALVPAFSVSRGQEVLTVIAERDPGWNVWVDGMIREVADIYVKHPGYVRLYGILAKALREYNVVRGWQDRKAALKEPGVIIASSGMLKGGPSLYYLKRLAENPKNAVFLVSFQGKNTPGRQILETGFALPEEMPIRARVEWFDFSSHIDQKGVLKLLKELREVQKVILVHGVPKAQEVLAQKIREDLGLETLAPAVGETVEI
ncbi:MAG: MBL fold metallo-hydrolase [Acidilobaceae archaeon]|nr:MBL fold metallo-hydrolase [Acidilobaceae archaeon]